ncbi:MAG: SGNH/GDSL hydrolase family protein, partial [Pseudomonadota bacterium]
MTPINQGLSAPKSAPKTGSRPLFFLIALILPLAFFALAEMVLRVAGIGAYPPLFVPTENVDGYLQPNEAVIHRFFTHFSQAPKVSIDTTYFHETKPDDTLRIVVMGGSSAAGFPYGKWASPAGMLKRRLRRSFPERDIEVISTAMSAMNSYALLDFTDEIIEIAPDAVVIYAGHNEYLGVLGVGSAYSSSQSPRLTRVIQGLRKLNLYRAIETALGRKVDASNAPRGTLMARIAGERAIEYQSALYNKGVEQFRSNMSVALRRFERAGVPVYLGTLASNLRDQAPFDGGAPGDGASIDRQINDGVAALTAGDVDAALRALTAAAEKAPTAADAHFHLGRAYLQKQEP